MQIEFMNPRDIMRSVTLFALVDILDRESYSAVPRRPAKRKSRQERRRRSAVRNSRRRNRKK